MGRGRDREGRGGGQHGRRGEGRDRGGRFGDRPGASGGGTTEQEFRERIRERLDRLDERVETLER